MTPPRLIEYSAKDFLFNNLQQCHINRVNVYYYTLNIGVFLAFVLIFGLTLYFCNKQKLSPYEQNQKLLRDQDYILSKIRFHKEDQKNLQQSQITGITNLPTL